MVSILYKMVACTSSNFFQVFFDNRNSLNMFTTAAFLVLCVAGTYVAAEEREPSACEMDRARRINSTLTTESILHLIPDCDANGDYSARQCFTDNDWCVCYRRNGENINTPSKNNKACDCVRAKDDAITAGESYVPECERNGYYKPKQCMMKECWCVDKAGKVLTDPATGNVTCQNVV